MAEGKERGGLGRTDMVRPGRPYEQGVARVALVFPVCADLPLRSGSGMNLIGILPIVASNLICPCGRPSWWHEHCS